MLTDQEVDDFIEHFGKKGMKWGVRRAKKIEESTPPKEVNKDRERNIKIAKVGLAAATTVLALYGGKKIAKTRNTRAMIKGAERAAAVLKIREMGKTSMNANLTSVERDVLNNLLKSTNGRYFG